MSPLLQILLLTCCASLVPVWMHYAEYPSEHYNVEPGSIVFPSSLISPFRTRNRVESVDDNMDLQVEYLHAVEALFAVTTRLKALLGRDTNKNVLVSPLSTTTALAEVLLGTHGTSRRHLLNLLSTVNRTSNTTEATVVEFHQQLGGLVKLLVTSPEYNDAYQLQFASALFLNPELRLTPRYQNAMVDLYGVDIIPLDFRSNPLAALIAMNKWSNTHTGGVIKKVFDHPLPITTAAVLINAIYFKGDWEVPFSPRYTIPGKFNSNDTHVIDVEYMRGQFDLMYVNSSRLGCRMIAMPYKHAKAAMYVVLPDTGNLYDIQKFASGLAVEDVMELITSTRLASVTLIMPKMKIAETFSLREVLSYFDKQIVEEVKEEVDAATSRDDKLKQNEGVSANRCHGWDCTQYSQERYNVSLQEEETNVHKPDSIGTINDTSMHNLQLDMSGASLDKRFRVDDILHHVFMEVTEVGTVAAAISGTTVDYIGDFKIFKIDRPFLFFIRHEVTGTPFFWGTIVDPTNGNDA